MIFSGPSGIKLGQMSRQKRCWLQCTCFREKGIFKHISKASYCSFLVAEIFMSRFETWVFFRNTLVYNNEGKMGRKHKWSGICRNLDRIL